MQSEIQKSKVLVEIPSIIAQPHSDNAIQEPSSKPPSEQLYPSSSSTDTESSATKTGIKSATINMVKGFIGVGILALPSGFGKSGWLGGLMCFIICSASIFYLSLKLLEVAAHRKSNARNVTEFWSECMGKEHALMANAFLFAIQLGICIAYLIFFATYFQESLCFFVNNNTDSFLCSSRIPSLFASVCLCAPSIFIRDMANLKHWSMFANALILVSLFVIIVASILEIKTSNEHIQAFNVSEIGNAIGIFVFAFEGTTLYFEVRHSMHKPNDFNHVLKYSMCGGVLLYGFVGFIGYLAFAIQISYCVAILLSYPLQMFPLISIVERELLIKIKEKRGYSHFSNQEKDNAAAVITGAVAAAAGSSTAAPSIGDNQDNNQDSIDDEKKMHSRLSSQQQQSNQREDSEEIHKEFMLKSNILRIATLLLVVLIATLFKQISTFLNLIGSISGCFFCFILPVLTYQKTFPHAEKNTLQFHLGLMVMGIVFSLTGTYSSLKELLS